MIIALCFEKVKLTRMVCDHIDFRPICTLLIGECRIPIITSKFFIVNSIMNIKKNKHN